jgi:cytochrome P450 family 110
LPFGGGNRRCIGMAFALLEMKLVLATVLCNWQMALADTKPVQPIRKGALLGPSEGVRMMVTGKRPQNQRILESTSVKMHRTNGKLVSQCYSWW